MSDALVGFGDCPHHPLIQSPSSALEPQTCSAGRGLSVGDVSSGESPGKKKKVAATPFP